MQLDQSFARQYSRIEAVRAISVVYVLIAHLDSVFITVPQWFVTLAENTHYGVGVIVFFVISGFVVSRSLYKRLESKPSIINPQAKRAELRAFYIRRFTRLMPLSVIWAAITIAGSYWANRVGYFGVWETNIKAFPAAIFYYANFQAFESWGTLGAFGVYWSLAVEEQFYVIIPLLLIFFSRRTSFLTLFVSLYLLMGLWRLQTDYIFWRALWFDGLIIGVLVYLGIGEKIVVSKRSIPIINTAFVIYSSVGFALLVEVFINSGSLYLPYVPTLSCLMFLWALVTYDGAQGSGIPNWLERVFLFIGARAYGLYLSHFTITMYNRELWHWIGNDGQPGLNEGVMFCLLVFLSWLVATLAVTELLYRFVEKPITNWGRSFS